MKHLASASRVFRARSILLTIVSIFATSAVILNSPRAMAKRAPPPDVQPIQTEEFNYHVKRYSAKDKYEEFVVCTDNVNNHDVWRTKVYEKRIDPNFEFDVQDIYLKFLKLDGDKILTEDEKGQAYKIDARTGKLLEPKKPVLYKKGM